MLTDEQLAAVRAVDEWCGKVVKAHAEQDPPPTTSFVQELMRQLPQMDPNGTLTPDQYYTAYLEPALHVCDDVARLFLDTQDGQAIQSAFFARNPEEVQPLSRYSHRFQLEKLCREVLEQTSSVRRLPQRTWHNMSVTLSSIIGHPDRDARPFASLCDLTEQFFFAFVEDQAIKMAICCGNEPATANVLLWLAFVDSKSSSRTLNNYDLAQLVMHAKHSHLRHGGIAWPELHTSGPSIHGFQAPLELGPSQWAKLNESPSASEAHLPSAAGTPNSARQSRPPSRSSAAAPSSHHVDVGSTPRHLSPLGPASTSSAHELFQFMKSPTNAGSSASVQEIARPDDWHSPQSHHSARSGRQRRKSSSASLEIINRPPDWHSPAQSISMPGTHDSRFNSPAAPHHSSTPSSGRMGNEAEVIIDPVRSASPPLANEQTNAHRRSRSKSPTRARSMSPRSRQRYNAYLDYWLGSHQTPSSNYAWFIGDPHLQSLYLKPRHYGEASLSHRQRRQYTDVSEGQLRARWSGW